MIPFLKFLGMRVESEYFSYATKDAWSVSLEDTGVKHTGWWGDIQLHYCYYMPLNRGKFLYLN